MVDWFAAGPRLGADAVGYSDAKKVPELVLIDFQVVDAAAGAAGDRF